MGIKMERNTSFLLLRGTKILTQIFKTCVHWLSAAQALF